MCEDDAIEFETQSSFDQFYGTTEGFFQWEKAGRKVKFSNNTILVYYSLKTITDDELRNDLILEEDSNLAEEYMEEICSFINCDNDYEIICLNPISVKGHCCQICGKSIILELDRRKSKKQLMYFASIRMNDKIKLYNNSYGISFARTTSNLTYKPTYQLVVFQANNSLIYNQTIIESIANDTLSILDDLSESTIKIISENASKNIIFWSRKRVILLIVLFLIILLTYIAYKLNLFEKLKKYIIRFIYNNVPEENFIIRYTNDNVNISKTKDETICLLSDDEECNTVKNA
uniref:Protein amnionless n=2 Tax=Strongyloides stercoralis TaxID=6248 RepID=A0A0K0EBV2_STRER